MLSRRASGGPTVADLQRLRAARRAARAEVAAAKHRMVEVRHAFRREFAATVRRTSPFLLALLEAEGMTLGSVLMLIVPEHDWPEWPNLYYTVRQWATGPRVTQQKIARVGSYGAPQCPERLPEIEFPLTDGGWMRVRVVGHSVEVKATIGATVFQTQFGEMTISIRSYLPDAIAAACVGRQLDEVATHSLTTGRGWRILAAEPYAFGTMITIETGSVPWRWSDE